MPVGERFRIAQVTPYAWEEPTREVNRYVAGLADGLVARGHEVVIVAPSGSRSLVRSSRGLIEAARDDPGALFVPGEARVIGVGQALPFPPARRGGSVAMPIDVARTLEELFDRDAFDFVHVHEPFAPSAASAALRYSPALNVGTFHAPTERILSTQVARRFVELLFGRLDARTTAFAVTGDLVRGFFGGEYEVVPPGAEIAGASPRAGARSAPPREIEIFCAAVEERAATRLFLRALRRLPLNLPWRATIWYSAQSQAIAPVALGRAIRERVRFVGPDDGSGQDFLAAADIAVAASAGVAPAPGYVVRALAAGVVPVASTLPVYREVLVEGDLGPQFEPGDVDTLAAQLQRLIVEPSARAAFTRRGATRAVAFGWDRVAGDFERIYGAVAARRHDPTGDAALRKRLARRPEINVDLHMHTDHSHDCATPVDSLLEVAKARGLGAIAVTDHNEVSGALAAAACAEGIKVIVGEEVKTKDQGEVIGLFIKEKIARDMTLEETIAEIRRQGGLVYVPHPFDRMHSVPDYENLLKVIDQIDIIEVFNPRVAIASFNEEAARFAAKYRIVAGAGSDSHVVQGLGSVKIAMRDFDGPAEFLESLRDADIVRRRSSLIYVQALKFIQTKTPFDGGLKAASANGVERPRRARAASKRAARKP